MHRLMPRYYQYFQHYQQQSRAILTADEWARLVDNVDAHATPHWIAARKLLVFDARWWLHNRNWNDLLGCEVDVVKWALFKTAKAGHSLLFCLFFEKLAKSTHKNVLRDELDVYHYFANVHQDAAMRAVLNQAFTYTQPNWMMPLLADYFGHGVLTARAQAERALVFSVPEADSHFYLAPLTRVHNHTNLSLVILSPWLTHADKIHWLTQCAASSDTRAMVCDQLQCQYAISWMGGRERNTTNLLGIVFYADLTETAVVTARLRVVDALLGAVAWEKTRVSTWVNGAANAGADEPAGSSAIASPTLGLIPPLLLAIDATANRAAYARVRASFSAVNAISADSTYFDWLYRYGARFPLALFSNTGVRTDAARQLQHALFNVLMFIGHYDLLGLVRSMYHHEPNVLPTLLALQAVDATRVFDAMCFGEPYLGSRSITTHHYTSLVFLHRHKLLNQAMLARVGPQGRTPLHSLCQASAPLYLRAHCVYAGVALATRDRYRNTLYHACTWRQFNDDDKAFIKLCLQQDDALPIEALNAQGEPAWIGCVLRGDIEGMKFFIEACGACPQVGLSAIQVATRQWHASLTAGAALAWLTDVAKRSPSPSTVVSAVSAVADAAHQPHANRLARWPLSRARSAPKNPEKIPLLRLPSARC